MLYEEIEELRACLPQGRTLFPYGKDWYAIQLLRLGLRRHGTMAALRKSGLGRLLDKENVRRWLGSLGKRDPTPGDLELLWPEQVEIFRLTLDHFDGWAQTSRRGRRGWNLVLQLNLNEEDARWMDRFGTERTADPFEWSFHPVHEGRHRTLAWARIDLDWSSGEALIEEVQNDRLRLVRSELRRLESCGDKLDAEGRRRHRLLDEYWNGRLALARRVWDEAILSAALRLIVAELGLRRVFYHTPESGVRYKGDGAKDAPLSVYTELPRRFCFRRTDETPRFLDRKTTRKRPPFHLLEL